VPLSDVSDALTRRPVDVTVVIDLQAAG